jgi:hypothetical protein
MRPPGGKPSNATSHFEGDQADEARDLYAERQPVKVKGLPKGVKVAFSRRGSIVVDTPTSVDVLHSVRTSAELDSLDRPQQVSSRGRVMGSKPDIQKEIFGDVRTATGHKLKVESFEWTQEDGFQPFDTRAPQGLYHSGKAGGASFTTQARMPAKIEKSGWLERGPAAAAAAYSAEDHNHSETDFHLQNPKLTQREDALDAHRMHGMNDMCDHCTAGFQQTLLAPSQRHVASYASEEPFGTQGKWNKAPSKVMLPQQHLARVRPESMQTPAMQQDFATHAADLRQLRTGAPAAAAAAAAAPIAEPMPPVRDKRPRAAAAAAAAASSVPAAMPKPRKSGMKHERDEEAEESIAARVKRHQPRRPTDG